RCPGDRERLADTDGTTDDQQAAVEGALLGGDAHGLGACPLDIGDIVEVAEAGEVWAPPVGRLEQAHFADLFVVRFRFGLLAASASSAASRSTTFELRRLCAGRAGVTFEVSLFWRGGRRFGWAFGSFGAPRSSTATTSPGPASATARDDASSSVVPSPVASAAVRASNAARARLA